MESEGLSEVEPRAQLEAYKLGAQAAEQRAHLPMPLWFWPTMALIGPAIVAYSRLEGALRIAVLAALLVPVAVVCIHLHLRDRANPSKPLSPFRGGRKNRWQFAAHWFVNFGVILAVNSGLGFSSTILPWTNGLGVAAFVYLFMAIPATFLWHKADQWTIAKTTAPVNP